MSNNSCLPQRATGSLRRTYLEVTRALANDNELVGLAVPGGEEPIAGYECVTLAQVSSMQPRSQAAKARTKTLARGHRGEIPLPRNLVFGRFDVPSGLATGASKLLEGLSGGLGLFRHVSAVE